MLGLYKQRIKLKTINHYSIRPQQLDKRTNNQFSKNTKLKSLVYLQNYFKRFQYAKNAILIIHQKLFGDLNFNANFMQKLLNLNQQGKYPEIDKFQQNLKNIGLFDLVENIQNLAPKEKQLITRQIEANFKTTKTKIKNGIKSSLPKPRKTNSVNNFSLTLTKEQYRIETGGNWKKIYPNIISPKHQQVMRLRLGNNTFFISLIKPPKNCINIKSISLVWKHGNVFLHYLYEKDEKTECNQHHNYAGLDVGYSKFITLAKEIDCFYQSDNAKINQKLKLLQFKYSKLQSKIDKNINLINNKYRLNRLMMKRDNILTQLKYQLAKEVKNFCYQHQIGKIVYSRTLMKYYQSKTKLHKSINKWFGNIPLGKILDAIIAKNHHIQFYQVDEALSSKIFYQEFKEVYPKARDLLTNINKLRDNNQDYTEIKQEYKDWINPKKIGKRCGRWFYPINRHKIDADVNGALNHINIYQLTSV